MLDKQNQMRKHSDVLGIPLILLDFYHKTSGGYEITNLRTYINKNKNYKSKIIMMWLWESLSGKRIKMRVGVSMCVCVWWSPRLLYVITNNLILLGSSLIHDSLGFFEGPQNESSFENMLLTWSYSFLVNHVIPA